MLTETQKDDLVGLFKAGIPVIFLADHFDVSARQVRAILRLKCGVKNTMQPMVLKKTLQVAGFGMRCEICGFDSIPEILVVHHKDGDHTNDLLSNQMVVCPNCHYTLHLSNGKVRFGEVPTSNPFVNIL